MIGRAAAILFCTTAMLALAGCSFLGPSRGPDGQFSEPTQINSADLLTGDCFTFDEGSNLATSTVVPCDVEHEFRVIGQGTLDDAAIAAAGDKQIAINAACDEPFADFMETVAEGVRPDQQFISATIEEDGEQLTEYSCLATDAPIVSAEG
ncbi:hypothetical protein M2152_001676 [Microbacteriaceae bacterium SG_E_30_P1]|uniref:Septum formation-related domain-containing protein n=1 Tax=Antiquaquibacter oligotrophicus TaxID=2880260 RepID=A0ABT6KQL7_9MICO|nr:septum formation family protein [Antiquaquibacter oligotrophicus]MDH6181494.1 hypothetical protein [Antiquaquibacter oligotrophicus]UDF12816.1 septum formation family protein [Antiquaquibacter oligotrophicus]